MKSRNTYVILLVLFLFSVTSLYAQQGRGRGRIKGSVVDGSGVPVEGVKVVAQHRKSNTLFEGKSDEKGIWAIAGLGTGVFLVTASKEGYDSASMEMPVSQFTRNNPAVNFTLNKTQASSTSEILAIEDESTLVLFEEGNQLFEQEKYIEAIAKYEEFLTANPTVYQVILNVGNCHRMLNEYDKAIESYQVILDKVMTAKGTYEGDESAARALASTGEIYMLMGDLDKAGEYMTQAIELFPNDEVLAFNVGEIFFNQGEPIKAIDFFKLATSIKEDWAPPYRQLGYTYLNKGEYQLAIDSLKKFLELAPDDPQAPTIRSLIPKLEEMVKKD